MTLRHTAHTRKAREENRPFAEHYFLHHGFNFLSDIRKIIFTVFSHYRKKNLLSLTWRLREFELQTNYLEKQFLLPQQNTFSSVMPLVSTVLGLDSWLSRNSTSAKDIHAHESIHWPTTTFKTGTHEATVLVKFVRLITTTKHFQNKNSLSHEANCCNNLSLRYVTQCVSGFRKCDFIVAMQHCMGWIKKNC